MGHIEGLQAAYDRMIGMSNHYFVLSNLEGMKPLQFELQGKSEAYESSADILHSEFPQWIIKKDTLRFAEARKVHLSEEETEPKVKQDA